MVDWLTAAIRNASARRRGTGGKVVMRRLNRVEYRNTMRDLLGLDLDYTKNLPPDELSRDGFKNNGSALRMSPLQLEYYLEAARRGLRSAIVAGAPPRIVAHRATETVADKVREHWSNRLGRTGTFVARSDAFPDEGEFLIRIRARAELPASIRPTPACAFRWATAPTRKRRRGKSRSSTSPPKPRRSSHSAGASRNSRGKAARRANIPDC